MIIKGPERHMDEVKERLMGELQSAYNVHARLAYQYSESIHGKELSDMYGLVQRALGRSPNPRNIRSLKSA
ncbi:MAG: hypothetical protein Q8P57_03720 [Candidatus Pacearchaeota archaeon]|nr:hypothetical protein [Candidatus Pacearchaeota archaeon]